MLDKEFVKNKIKFIQQELVLLEKYKGCSLQEIVSDYIKHSVVERILERVINDALDINQHIIAESGKIEVPNDYRDTFLALPKIKIMPEKFTKEIAMSVGLRNILVHNYRKLNEEIFYNSIKTCLRDYTKYCDYILQYIKKIKWQK